MESSGSEVVLGTIYDPRTNATPTPDADVRIAQLGSFHSWKVYFYC